MEEEIGKDGSGEYPAIYVAKHGGLLSFWEGLGRSWLKSVMQSRD